MNLRNSGIATVLALAAMAFAAPQAQSAATSGAAVPAPAQDVSAPAAAPVAPENAPIESATESAPGTEPAAEGPAIAEGSANSQAESAAEAPAAEAAPTEEAAAPMAVRGGEAPAASSAPVPEQEAAPAAAAPAPTKTVVYRTVYASEPVELSGTKVHTVYVSPTDAQISTSFDDLRGLIPMKWSLGVQGFIGSYHMYSSYSDDYYLHDYDGLTWRAGLVGIIPVTDYTIGVKVAALFEQSEAKASGHTARYSLKGKFKQRKIDVPVLFAFKAPRSSLMFEIGTQASMAIKDEFKATIDGKSSRIDMLDRDFRNTIDWDIVCGFSIMANQYLGFDFRFNIGISNLYDTDNSEAMKLFEVDDLSSTSFLLGASFYLF